jgi:hypothetical protein
MSTAQYQDQYPTSKRVDVASYNIEFQLTGKDAAIFTHKRLKDLFSPLVIGCQYDMFPSFVNCKA